MVKNIILTSLDYSCLEEIGELVAENTDLYFLDGQKYVDYMLISRENVLNTCGVEYLEKKENSAIKQMFTFENSIICIPAEYLIRKNFNEYLNDSYVIYISHKLNALKQKIENSNCDLSFLSINSIDYKKRHNTLQEICTAEIENGKRNLKNIANLICCLIKETL